MNVEDLLAKLEGVQTIESISIILGIDKRSAIYHVWKLRNARYVRTNRLRNNQRVYDISKNNAQEGMTYYDVINEYSPINIRPPFTYKLYKQKPTVEEALIFAIKTQSPRTLLA